MILAIKIAIRKQNSLFRGGREMWGGNFCYVMKIGERLTGLQKIEKILLYSMRKSMFRQGEEIGRNKYYFDESGICKKNIWIEEGDKNIMQCWTGCCEESFLESAGLYFL